MLAYENISMQPATLSALVMNITRPLGNESDEGAHERGQQTTVGPGRRTTSSWAPSSRACSTQDQAIAAMNSALSARDEKASAAITKIKPAFQECPRCPPERLAPSD